MTITFGFVQQATAQANPSNTTLSVTAGNLLIVHAMERSGTTQANFVISDTQGGTWTKHVGRDVELANASNRRTYLVWSRVVEVSGSVTVSVDNGTANNIRSSLSEWQAGAAVTWTFEAAASNDNGLTDDVETLATGTTASVPAGDLMLVGSLGIKRTSEASVIPPSTWASSALAQIFETSAAASNGMIIHVGMLQESASGTKASTATFDAGNPDNDGLCGSMLVFSASEGGGGTTTLNADAWTSTSVFGDATLRGDRRISAEAWTTTSVFDSMYLDRAIAAGAWTTQSTFGDATLTVTSDETLVAEAWTLESAFAAANLLVSRRLVAEAWSSTSIFAPASLLVNRSLSADSWVSTSTFAPATLRVTRYLGADAWSSTSSFGDATLTHETPGQTTITAAAWTSTSLFADATLTYIPIPPSGYSGGQAYGGTASARELVDSFFTPKETPRREPPKAKKFKPPEIRFPSTALRPTGSPNPRLLEAIAAVAEELLD